MANKIIHPHKQEGRRLMVYTNSYGQKDRRDYRLADGTPEGAYLEYHLSGDIRDLIIQIYRINKEKPFAKNLADVISNEIPLNFYDEPIWYSEKLNDSEWSTLLNLV